MKKILFIIFIFILPLITFSQESNNETFKKTSRLDIFLKPSQIRFRWDQTMFGIKRFPFQTQIRIRTTDVTGLFGITIPFDEHARLTVSSGVGYDYTDRKFSPVVRTALCVNLGWGMFRADCITDNNRLFNLNTSLVFNVSETVRIGFMNKNEILCFRIESQFILNDSGNKKIRFHVVYSPIQNYFDCGIRFRLGGNINYYEKT